MVHFGDAASSTETTVRLGSSSYTGRVPIPQAKPENSFSNVSRRWPSYWSLVRGRTSSIHSELIPTTAKQQLPFLELTYMRVPIAVSFANEIRLDLIQPNHKSVPFFTSFLGTPDLIMIDRALVMKRAIWTTRKDESMAHGGWKNIWLIGRGEKGFDMYSSEYLMLAF